MDGIAQTVNVQTAKLDALFIEMEASFYEHANEEQRLETPAYQRVHPIVGYWLIKLNECNPDLKRQGPTITGPLFDEGLRV